MKHRSQSEPTLLVKVTMVTGVYFLPNHTGFHQAPPPQGSRVRGHNTNVRPITVLQTGFANAPGCYQVKHANELMRRKQQIRALLR